MLQQSAVRILDRLELLARHAFAEIVEVGSGACRDILPLLDFGDGIGSGGGFGFACEIDRDGHGLGAFDVSDTGTGFVRIGTFLFC